MGTYVIGGQVMPGICGAGSTSPAPYIQAALMQNASKYISPYTVLLTNLALIHTPQLVSAHLRILFPHLLNKLYHKLFYCQSAEQDIVISFVKGLSCNTGQCTECLYWVFFFSVQPFDCPVSAFFRISMLNVSYATSTIVSKKSARICSS